MSSNMIFQASSPIEQTPYSTLATSAWGVCRTVSLSDCMHSKVLPLLNPAICENKENMRGLRAHLIDQEDSPKIITFLVPTGAKIDGVFYSARSESAEKKAIIFALGSGGAYEKIANSQDAAAHFVQFLRKEFGEETGLLVINYEGIIESEGTAGLDNWAIDLYSAYEFLKSNGHDHILIYGHSLGGHLTLKACEKIFLKFQEAPPVVDDRSFKSSSALISHYAGAGISGMLAQGLTSYCGLNSEVAPLSGQKVLLINATDDPTIPLPLAMTSKFDESSDVEKMIISGDTPEFSSHTRPFSPDEQIKVTTFVKNALNLKCGSPS